MEFVRILYYFLNSIRLNICFNTLHIALSARIKHTTKFGKYIKIGRRTCLTGEVGDYSYIAGNCRLNANIGKYCSISPNVKTIEATHPIHMVSLSPVFYSPARQCGYSYSDNIDVEEWNYIDKVKKIAVQIGNDVWIGENVLIKGGVKIGDGSIIGMGAVVTKDIPPYCIYGGIPAKEIGRRFDKITIERLSILQWWDKGEQWIKKNLDIFQNLHPTNEDIRYLSELEND